METLVIDVREPFEYDEGHVEGAVNIPPMQLLSHAPQLDDVPKDTPIIVYCRTGSRSNTAIHILNDLGFHNVTNGINKEQVEARSPN